MPLTIKSLISFFQIFYKEVNGVAMGFYLCLAIVYAFLVYFRKTSLQNCSAAFTPHYNWHYVYDILFDLPEDV